MYNPKEDWKLRNVKFLGLGGAEYEYTFESLKVYEGSSCIRNIMADTEEEAWKKVAEKGEPRW